MKKPLYSTLASLVQARLNCIKANNSEWLIKHEQAACELVKSHMPSGSGIDCGTKLDIDRSNGDKLVFTFSFHHMNENDMYDGWTDHTAIVTPSLAFGFDLMITGRDRNRIKEYLHDIFHYALQTEIDR